MIVKNLMLAMAAISIFASCATPSIDQGIKFYQQADDATLREQVSDAIFGRENFNINTLPDHERVVVVIYTAQKIIDEGGFYYFFGSDFKDVDGYEFFVQAYEAIGSDEAARAIQEALTLFPGGKPQKAIRERRAFLDDELGGPTGQLTQIQGAIQGQATMHMMRLSTYIRANAQRFLESVRLQP